MATKTYLTSGGEPIDSPISAGPASPPVQGRKPTREERKAANRAKKDAVQLAEHARLAVPEALRAGKSAGPQDHPVTVLPTAQERREQARAAIEEASKAGALTRGRLSQYTEDEAASICTWIAEGGSLRGYCRATGRAMVAIQTWLRERADFQARYSDARKDRADTLAEEAIEIADSAALNPTIEGVAAAKLRVETRKWFSAKTNPENWGDKQTVQHTGAVSIRIGVPAKPQLPTADVVDVQARIVGE
jgi:hypothetical protein